MQYNKKRTRKFSKRAQLWISHSKFYKFRAFRMLHLPKWHVVLKVFPENKLFNLTACNKWLKEAPQIQRKKQKQKNCPRNLTKKVTKNYTERTCNIQYMTMLKIHWRLIFAIVIHGSRLRLWVGYFIYFRFTPVLF